MSETKELEYKEYVIAEGRATGSSILCGSADSCATEEDKFIMFDVIIQSAVHIHAVAYYNEVIAHMRKSGPVTEEDFFAKLKTKILAEVEEIKANMSFAVGSPPH